MMAVSEDMTSSPSVTGTGTAIDSAVNLPCALCRNAEFGSDHGIETIGADLASIVFQDGRLASVSADEATIFTLDQDRAREGFDAGRGAAAILADLEGAVDDGGESGVAITVDQGETDIVGHVSLLEFVRGQFSYTQSLPIANGLFWLVILCLYATFFYCLPEVRWRECSGRSRRLCISTPSTVVHKRWIGSGVSKGSVPMTSHSSGFCPANDGTDQPNQLVGSSPTLSNILSVSSRGIALKKARLLVSSIRGSQFTRAK